MKFASSDAEKQRSIGDVPGGAHLVAQRDAGIAGGRDSNSAFAGSAGARINCHRRVYQSRKDNIGAYTELSVLDSHLLSEGDHTEAFVAL